MPKRRRTSFAWYSCMFMEIYLTGSRFGGNACRRVDRISLCHLSIVGEILSNACAINSSPTAPTFKAWDYGRPPSLPAWFRWLTPRFFARIEAFFHGTFGEANRSHWSFLVTPSLFLAAWYLVRRFAPEAAGSGIPQVMAANEMDYRGAAKVCKSTAFCRYAPLVVKSAQLTCSAFSAAAQFGREGPTLQNQHQPFPLFRLSGSANTCRKPRRRFGSSPVPRPVSHRRSTLPLGGIVYVIEELGVAHFHKIRTALVSAVIISGLVAQWILGSYLVLGFSRNCRPSAFRFCRSR